jgi:hypothetical protein
MEIANTASLKATNRPGVRSTEGESCPDLPPGARAVASERTQGITDATRALLVGDGIVQPHRPGPRQPPDPLRPEPATAELFTALVGYVEAKSVTPSSTAVYPLEDAVCPLEDIAAAHRSLEKNGGSGKPIVQVA